MCLLISMLILTFNNRSINAYAGTIYIKADGTIEPETAPISTDDKITYIFTDDIIDNSIVVERSGITIDGCGRNLIATLDITYGLTLSSVTRVTVKNMSIMGFLRGLRLYNSFYNIIVQNNITDNRETGIELYQSSNNSFYSNIIANNGHSAIYGGYGIHFMYSSGNIFRDNNFTGNKRYNLFLSAGGSDDIANFIQDIDESNVVNGKPIYYLVNRANIEVPSVAGYVGLINCRNITVNGAELKYNSQGVFLANTTNSKILNCIIEDNHDGIRVWKSSNNFFYKNVITKNYLGISFYESHDNMLYENLISFNDFGGVELYRSSDNEVFMNNITSNNKKFEPAGGGIYITMYSTYNIIHKNFIAYNQEHGVHIGVASRNSIRGNNITNNSGTGVYVYGSYNIICENNFVMNGRGILLSEYQTYENKIFHNNFIDNAEPSGIASTSASKNYWDNGYPFGGNYWTEYTYGDMFNGLNQDQLGNDGIGDIPIIMNPNNIDRYPLMAPVTVFYAGTWNDVVYNVDVISNSTVLSFSFDPEEGAFLRFNVTGDDGTTGFCRVAIPKSLLWVDDGWTITVDDQAIIDYLELKDESFTYLYFTYNHSTKTITIQGTNAIPEFPSTTPTLTILILATLTTIIWKAKRKHQAAHFSVSRC